MAIIDSLLEFADATSVAASAGTALIGDVIDLGVARDIGVGKPMYLVIQTQTEIITGGAAGTLTFKLVSDSVAAIATNGDATEHFVSKAFVTDDAGNNAAELNAGGRPVVIALPQEGAEYEQFLGILAVTATTTTTAGAIDAFITSDISAWKAYAEGDN